MKFSNRYITMLVAALLVAVLLTGCGKQAEVLPPKPEMGVLNMAKAIKAHPRYLEVAELQKQRDSLIAQLSAQQMQFNATSHQAELSINDLAKSTEQEFQTKMAGKQAELNRQLQAKAEALRKEVSEQVDKYVRELDESYQTRNFELQAKLKTLSLNKEEQAAIQTKIDAIQNERMEKIVARQQQLTNGTTEWMKQAEQTAGRDLEAFAKQLKQQLDVEFAKKAQAMKTPPADIVSLPQAPDSLDAKLAAADRALAKLQQDIVSDIKNRAAAVAKEQGLTTVLADVEIFTALARDITADVTSRSK